MERKNGGLRGTGMGGVVLNATVGRTESLSLFSPQWKNRYWDFPLRPLTPEPVLISRPCCLKYTGSSKEWMYPFICVSFQWLYLSVFAKNNQFSKSTFFFFGCTTRLVGP